MSWEFFDTNIYGDCNDEYDISGKEYEKLLEVCFKYCNTLMLKFESNDAKNVERFEKHRTSQPKGFDGRRAQLFTLFAGCENPKEQFRFYKLCPELLELMKETSNSIFGWVYDWYSTPDDPVFIRSDGSIFFNSITHEGKITLFPRDGEDVSEIISNELWLPSNRQNWFNA